MLRVSLIALAVMIASACDSNDAPVRPRATSGKVVLPAGVAVSDVRLLTARGVQSLEADGTYAVDVAPDQGQLLMITAADEPERLLLMRVAHSGRAGDIDATSTAMGLLMLSPGLACLGDEALADLEASLSRLPELSALAAQIGERVAGGRDLLSLAGDPAFAGAWADTIAAWRRSEPRRQLQPLRVRPEGERDGVELVPVGGRDLRVFNSASRWLSVYGGPIEQHQLLGLVEPSPDFISVRRLLAGGATRRDLQPPVALGDAFPLHVYGPGIEPPAADCPAPEWTELPLAIPTLATFVDNLLEPALGLAMGVRPSALPRFASFTAFLVTQLLSQREILEAFVQRQWARLAGLTLKVGVNALLHEALDLDDGAGRGRAELLERMIGGTVFDDGNGLGRNWLADLLLDAGIGAVQARVTALVLPLRLVAAASDVADIAGGVHAVWTSPPATCFSVDDHAPPDDRDPSPAGQCSGCVDPDSVDRWDDVGDVLTDRSTGLVWQRGATSGLFWEEAVAHCDALSLGGRGDWRLPTIDELRSLVDHCPDSELGGRCPVTDPGCLAIDCSNVRCRGACAGSLPEEGLCFRVGAPWEAPCEHYWSRSELSEGISAWMLSFRFALIDVGFKESEQWAQCVAGP